MVNYFFAYDSEECSKTEIMSLKSFTVGKKVSGYNFTLTVKSDKIKAIGVVIRADSNSKVIFRSKN